MYHTDSSQKRKKSRLDQDARDEAAKNVLSKWSMID